MPIPSFRDTLEGALGPGISIISAGSYFDAEDAQGTDIATMNEELAGGPDEIVFLPADAPKEDASLNFFLNSRKKGER